MMSLRKVTRGAGVGLLALAAATLLAGCGGGVDELQGKLNELMKRPGGRIDPLPELRPYESFNYDPTNLRSPFQPSAPAVTPGLNALRPDAHRNREFLEAFSLDTLRMVGTLKQGAHTFGLVQTKDGLVHRVLAGNYIGQNDGKVVAISDSRINVLEIVPDGLGGYTERPASLALTN
jgi:type IV pilus assembly protein PilP